MERGVRKAWSGVYLLVLLTVDTESSTERNPPSLPCAAPRWVEQVARQGPFLAVLYDMYTVYSIRSRTEHLSFLVFVFFVCVDGMYDCKTSRVDACSIIPYDTVLYHIR